MKTFLLSAFLIIASLTGLRAQDKYELATVTYFVYDNTVATSINGKDYSEEKAVLSKSEAKFSNTNPLLGKVNLLQDQGWELLKIDIGMVGSYAVYFATLRKKKA